MVKSGIYQKEVQIELTFGHEQGVEHSFFYWLTATSGYISLILNFLWVFDSWLNNLLLLGNGTTCLPNVIYLYDFIIIMYHLKDIKNKYINDDKANHWPIKGLEIEKKITFHQGITLYSLGGVFISTAVGLVIAMLVLVAEVMYYKKKDNRHMDISTGDKNVRSFSLNYGCHSSFK